MQFKKLSFSTLAVIILVMVAATVVEHYHGTDFVQSHIYTSWWFIVLWALLAVSGLIYLCQRIGFPPSGGIKGGFVFALHLSFVLILLGALVTHIFGTKEQLHLRLGQSSHGITLTDFRVINYPGTESPMDYVSTVKAGDRTETISMNHILRYHGYRFYQTAYDPDCKGTILQVTHDPWGIGITYTAYALMLLSFLCLLWQKASVSRKSSISSISRKSCLLFALLFATSLTASATPQVLQRGLARSYGETYTYYNGRVCPMNTRAVDFTTKLCGKPAFKDKTSGTTYTADQVLSGFFFYYDDWKQVPIIKVKGDAVKHALGIKGKYARLTDFYRGRDYRLQKLLDKHDKNAIAADEKVQLISMAVTGSLYQDDYLFSMEGVNQAAGCIYQGRNRAANQIFHELRHWQRRQLRERYRLASSQDRADALSDRRFEAELLYNRIHLTRPLSMALTSFGLLLYILALFFPALTSQTSKTSLTRLTSLTSFLLASALALFLAFMFILRWYVSGHLPLASGFEVMQFMSLTVVVYGLCTRMRQPAIVFLLSGLTLMVSMMGESNPQITNLMPVLQSPLLSLHVCVIMLAYCLLAIQFLQSLAWLIKSHTSSILNQPSGPTMQLLAAVALLAIGIFLGAVWANVSWGAYWSWDPKEVWALITLFVYCLPLHAASISWFRNPRFYHWYLFLAFLSVLFTYFGVNFLLGGMHSYA